MLLCCCLAPFTSTRRTPLSCLVRAGLALMNPLSFCLFEILHLSFIFLKDTFAGYTVLCWYFFLSLLWIYHVIPFCSGKFPMRSPLLVLLGLPLCNESLFSFCFQISLFVLEFWQFNYNIKFRIFFCCCLFWLLESGYPLLFPDLGSFQLFNFYAPVSPHSEIPIIQTLIHIMMSIRSLRLT